MFGKAGLQVGGRGGGTDGRTDGRRERERRGGATFNVLTTLNQDTQFLTILPPSLPPLLPP